MDNKRIDLGFGAWVQKRDRYYIIGNPEATIILSENQFRRLVADNAKRIMKDNDEIQEALTKVRRK